MNKKLNKNIKLSMNEEKSHRIFSSIWNLGSMITLILILFASVVSAAVDNNAKVIVFNDGVNLYLLPVQSIDWEDGKIDYVDLLGVHRQCSTNYVLCIYSDRAEKLLESMINSIFRGISEEGEIGYSYNPNFPREEKRSYKIEIDGKEYAIRYSQGDSVKIGFNVEEDRTYDFELYGMVKNVPFSVFEVKIDDDTVDNIFSGNRFFFLNEKTFGSFITATTSGMSLKTHLKKGEHTIELIPLVNPDYLFISRLYLK